jgi:hypothetical protein
MKVIASQRLRTTCMESLLPAPSVPAPSVGAFSSVDTANEIDGGVVVTGELPSDGNTAGKFDGGSLPEWLVSTIDSDIMSRSIEEKHFSGTLIADGRRTHEVGSCTMKWKVVKGC